MSKLQQRATEIYVLRGAFLFRWRSWALGGKPLPCEAGTDAVQPTEYHKGDRRVLHVGAGTWQAVAAALTLRTVCMGSTGGAWLQCSPAALSVGVGK